MKRLQRVKKTLEIMGGRKDDPEAYKEIFTAFLVKNKELALEAYRDPRLTFQATKLSPKESLDLMISLGWTTRDYRRNISVLNSLGKNYLASTNSMRKVKSDAIEKQPFEKGSRLFFKDTKCDTTVECAYSQVPNIKTMVYSYLEEFRGSEESLVVIDDKYVVLFGGDKGGEMKSNYTKFAFNIVKKDAPQDYGSFCIYAMYNGPDHYENMVLLHRRYHEQIMELMTEESSLGKKLLCVLNGDFSHCSSMLGHQGIVNLNSFHFF